MSGNVLAYSLDKGRTFTKYEGNPVIDSKSKWNSTDLRDPKVFWYEPDKNWVMVLFERDGNSIYTSANLKEWEYRVIHQVSGNVLSSLSLRWTGMITQRNGSCTEPPGHT